MADVPNAELRKDGFLKGFEGFDNIKVVSKQPADWMYKKVMMYVQHYLGKSLY